MTAAGPRFSILTPVFDPDPTVLKNTVESVLAQDFPDWELILTDDASTDPRIRPILAGFAERDGRIRVVLRDENGGIVAASNDALAAATGEFVALLDHDDLLTKDALAVCDRSVDDETDYLYSDEDKIDENGNHYDEFAKPDWSPERLLGQMYTSHLSVLRTAVVRQVGGFRPGFEGSQDHDLVLRVTEVARKVVHVRKVLYHWRNVAGSAAADPDAKPYARLAGIRAVSEALERRGIVGTLTDVSGHPGWYHISRKVTKPHRVSVIIPTRGTSALIWGRRRSLVVEAVQSVVTFNPGLELEFVVVYDAETPAQTLEELRGVAGATVLLVPYTQPFNYSEKTNLGFCESTGDILVLLNDDIEARSWGCLERLIAPLEEPDVGMTGAKLFFADGTIQHAGHSYAHGGHYHPYTGTDGAEVGFMGDLVISREVSGVTAAAAAVRREDYEAVGGLSELLPGNFNDVDLCYKVRKILGKRILWVADAEFYHFESMTRDSTVEAWEPRTITARWGSPKRDDYLPYCGPLPVGV